MNKWLRSGLVLLTAGAVGSLFLWGPADGFTGAVSAKPPGPKERGPKGPGKKKDHLQKTYEALTEVSVWMKSDRPRPPRDLSRLFDRASDLYRDAVKASQDEDDRRVDELGLAAHDAARGLLHVLRADAPAAKGLPAPPPRNEDELDDLLRRTRDRLEDADNSAPEPGRAFLDAARRLYDQARRADGERALQLARAAEAWTHVGEHLNRAEDRTVRRGEPERRRDRPLPPDDRPRRPRPPRGPERDAPPPPPPEQ